MRPLRKEIEMILIIIASALIGALIGAFITLVITSKKFKDITATHMEEMMESNSEAYSDGWNAAHSPSKREREIHDEMFGPEK